MPTVIIPDKICPHCNGTKWKQRFVTNKKGEVLTTYNCYERFKEALARYYQTPKYRELIKRNWINNKEKLSKRNREWATNNTNLDKTIRKNRNNRYTKDLSDVYVKCLLTRRSEIKRSQITAEMIEIERKSIQLQRELKLTNYGKSN
jgi:hypothetical protein